MPEILRATACRPDAPGGGAGAEFYKDRNMQSIMSSDFIVNFSRIFYDIGGEADPKDVKYHKGNIVGNEVIRIDSNTRASKGATTARCCVIPGNSGYTVSST